MNYKKLNKGGMYDAIMKYMEGGRMYRAGGAVPQYLDGGVNGDEEDPEKKTKKPARLPLSKRKGLRFSRNRGRAENERLYDELIQRYLDPEVGTGVGDAQSHARIAGDADDQARLDRKYARMDRLQDRQNRAQDRFLRRGVNPNTGMPTALARLARNKKQTLSERARLLDDEIQDLRVGDRNMAAREEMRARGMEVPVPTYLGRFSF